MSVRSTHRMMQLLFTFLAFWLSACCAQNRGYENFVGRDVLYDDLIGRDVYDDFDARGGLYDDSSLEYRQPSHGYSDEYIYGRDDSHLYLEARERADLLSELSTRELVTELRERLFDYDSAFLQPRQTKGASSRSPSPAPKGRSPSLKGKSPQNSRPGTPEGTRKMYLFVHKAGKDILPHWSIFIPENNGAVSSFGKIIHATGNIIMGQNFKVEVKHHNDNTRGSVDTGRAFLLGSIPASLIVDKTTFSQTTTPTAGDAAEAVAFSITPRPLDKAALAALPTMPKAKNIALLTPNPGLPNCQNWVADYLHALAADSRFGLKKADLDAAMTRARALTPKPPT